MAGVKGPEPPRSRRVPQVTRGYDARRKRAEVSRRKVLRAARDAFVESGYHGATMAEIAERSGFAVQTVSYFFGSKPRLLSELITASVERAVGDVPPLDTAEWEEARGAAADGHALVRAFIDLGYDILSAVAPVMEVARIGGLTDPEVAEIYLAHEDWRETDLTRLVAELDSLGALREGLSVECAADVALTIFGPEVYMALRTGREWEDDAIRAGMTDSLTRLLLREA